jgi:hypothetical protein
MELQDNNEYTITIDDVVDNSEFEQSDLADVFGEGIEYSLINISKKTYRVMYSAYIGWNIEQQRLEMQEIINDDEDKQQVMLEAIVEYVRGAVNSGLDLQIYLGKQGYSDDVIDILRTGGLWIKGEIIAADDIKAT